MATKLFTIRTPPDAIVSGKYATAEGEGNPIKLEDRPLLLSESQKVADFIIDDLLGYIDNYVYQWTFSTVDIIHPHSVQILSPDSSSGWAAQTDVTGRPKVTLEPAPGKVTTWIKRSVPGHEDTFT